MLLAADHFIHDYPSHSEEASFTLNSRLLAFFRDFDKHVGYVTNLTGLVNVNLLTQENVSCLNTSLVILMLNRKRNKLKEVIKEISQRREPPYGMSIRANDSGKGMLENLCKLLRFW